MPPIPLQKCRVAVSLLIGSVLLTASAMAASSLNPEKHIGNKDAVLVADLNGKYLLSKNVDTPLIPASILKIFTSLLALHHFGSEYRFATDFYMDPKGRLTVKGFGDTMWISESISAVARKLARKIRRIDGIVLDDTHFARHIGLPGITDSFEPYDAPNGALCANFNTVHFRRVGAQFVSAEPQTPLLPMILDRIRRSRLNEGRILLTGSKREALLYAGRLLRYFLEKEGVVVTGGIEVGQVNPFKDRLFLHALSPYPLRDIVKNLLAHSNNFMANQLLITVGIQVFGPPGTLAKGVEVARQFAADPLGTDSIDIVEGSGISRKNRVTASAMHRVLERFEPHRRLLVYRDGLYAKTGTLNGVRTLAGYMEKEPGKIHPFVILMNSPGKSVEPILSGIRSILP